MIAEYHINGIDGWEDFEKVAVFLGRRFRAKITKKLDGVHIRAWMIRIGKNDLSLSYHQDVGIYFKVGSGKIAKSVADALKEKLGVKVVRFVPETQKMSAWVKYEGPREGKGWRHTGTGEIRYVDDQPGDEPVSKDSEETKDNEELSDSEDFKKNRFRAKAFKRWFGDWENDPGNASKVVGGNGEPSETNKILEVYHGTSAQFDEFQKRYIGSNGLVVGNGFYFSENPEIADIFASMSRRGRVVKAYLNIRNPFDFDRTYTLDEVKQWIDLFVDGGKSSKTAKYSTVGSYSPEEVKSELRRSFGRNMEPNGNISGRIAHAAVSSLLGNESVNNFFAAVGFDGIVHRSGDKMGSPIRPRSEWGEFGKIWIAFEPTQIKSIDNSGSFDPNNPNIRMSSWVEYTGPRHGKGWQNNSTGEIRYQEDRPEDEWGRFPLITEEFEESLSPLEHDPKEGSFVYKQDGRELKEGRVMRRRSSQNPDDVGVLYRSGGAEIVNRSQLMVPTRSDNLRADLLRAFHGSPHSIDSFKTDKIGTGEGHQAFGWGLYFTDTKDIADFYKNTVINHGEIERINKEMSRLVDEMDKYRTPGMEYGKFNDPRGYELKKKYGQLLVERDNVRTAKGKMYEVDLAPESDEYLMWDVPAKKQRGKALESVKALLASPIFDRVFDEEPGWQKITGEKLYHALIERFFLQSETDIEASSASEWASKVLKSFGIRGIKYRTGNSRSKYLMNALWRNESDKKKYVSQSGLEESEFDKWVKWAFETTNYDVSDEPSEIADAVAFEMEWQQEAERDAGNRENKIRLYGAIADAVRSGDLIPPNPSYNYVIFDDSDVSIVDRMAIRMSSWEQYTGPRGGTGWKNSGTGEIRYQEDEPDDSGRIDSKREIKTNLEGDAHKQIAEKIIEDTEKHGAYSITKIAQSLGVDPDQPLTVDDQNIIAIKAGVYGDLHVTEEMERTDDLGQTRPFAVDGIGLRDFVYRLGFAIRHAGRKARQKKIQERVKGARVVVFKNESGGRLVVHPAVRSDKTSDWQLTTLGPDRIPWGHNNPPTFEEAVNRAIGASDDYYWNEHGYELEWTDKDEGPRPIGMSSVSWSRYDGPRGGKGWKNDSTGEIRYQEKIPDGAVLDSKNRKPLKERLGELKDAYDRGELTMKKVAEGTEGHRERGGIASKARDSGFYPAFRDSETGEVYRSAIGVHVFDGLPDEIVTMRDEDGPTALKSSVTEGFVKDGKFFTREEASQSMERMKKVRAWADKKWGDAIAPNGNPIAENFSKWFGDSRVVDEDGNPRVAYHGSPHGNFDSFDVNRRGTGADQHGFGDYGDGLYFTLNMEEAKGYANGLVDEKVGDNPHVFDVFLRMENPFTFKKTREFSRLIWEKTRERGGLFNVTDEDEEEIIRSIGTTREELEFINHIEGLMGDNHSDFDISGVLKEKEYDGVISPNGEHVVFDSNQIKSASDNDGNFDQENNRIRMSSWDQYSGPRGGKGWKHKTTGEVRYQDNEPTEQESGDELSVDPLVSKTEEIDSPIVSMFDQSAEERIGQWGYSGDHESGGWHRGGLDGTYRHALARGLITWVWLKKDKIQDHQRLISQIESATSTDYLRGLLSNLDDSIQDGFHEVNPHLSDDAMFVEHYMDQADEMVKDSTPSIRCATSILRKIISDGRLKSQFETKTSNGFLDNKMRSDRELEMFSAPTDLPPEKRPIYGYLNNLEVGEGVVDGYGDVVIELKKDIMKRTTFTFGDSLDAMLLPSYANSRREGREQCVDWSRAQYREVGEYGDIEPRPAYIEAQYHGGVSVSDIERVKIPRVLVEAQPDLIQKIQELGIEIHVAKGVGRWEKLEQLSDSVETTA